MCNDSFNDIQKLILEFRDARNWKQFHAIKDLLIGLNIECAELEELFLWKVDGEIANIEKGKIEEELADIFIYLTYLSKHFDVDLLEATKKKIKINESKYPIDKSWGSSKKHNELDS